MSSHQPEKKITPPPDTDIRDLILDMARAGFRQSCIARELQISDWKVWRALQGTGLNAREKTQARLERIRELAPTHTGPQMARILGMSPKAVGSLCSRHDIQISRQCRRRPPDEIEQIRELAARGFTQAEIGLVLQRHQPAISMLMRIHRIKPTARKQQPVKSWVELSVRIEDVS